LCVTKSSLHLHRGINHKIWKHSLVAMTEKVLCVLSQPQLFIILYYTHTHTFYVFYSKHLLFNKLFVWIANNNKKVLFLKQEYRASTHLYVVPYSICSAAVWVRVPMHYHHLYLHSICRYYCFATLFVENYIDK